MIHACGVLSRKSLLNPRLKKCFSIFCKKPRFLPFTFMSVFQFMLIFVCGTRYELKWVVLLLMSNWSSTICWKYHLFSIYLPWHFYQKLIDHICEYLFFGLSCSFDLWVYAFASTTLPYLQLVLKLGSVILPSTLFFFSSPSSFFFSPSSCFPSSFFWLF